ncbi:MAG: phosphoribosylformylglycinamidine cyclo-ligase [Pseudomonadota bacterium]
MADNPLDPYKNAGVDVEAGDALVQRIKPLAAATHRPGAEPVLGGFGAAFDLTKAGRSGALLVASTDGVGTKLRLAGDLNKHDGIGIDLVAMCVNDVLAQGAEPLFFLDYYASSKLDVAAAATVIEGIAKGCVEAGCALIGGETAEMPGHYAPGDYDLAGFVVGAVDPADLLPRTTFREGDVLIGLPSSGIHANGFSLVRKCARERQWDFGQLVGEVPLGDALLAPTRIYVKPVLAALSRDARSIRGLAHITGGGITGNVPRMLPDHLAAQIDRDAMPRLPIMEFLKDEASLSEDAMAATFNCGIGLVMAVAQEGADKVMETLSAEGEAPIRLGTIQARHPSEPQCLIR